MSHAVLSSQCSLTSFSSQLPLPGFPYRFIKSSTTPCLQLSDKINFSWKMHGYEVTDPHNTKMPLIKINVKLQLVSFYCLQKSIVTRCIAFYVMHMSEFFTSYSLCLISMDTLDWLTFIGMPIWRKWWHNRRACVSFILHTIAKYGTRHIICDALRSLLPHNSRRLMRFGWSTDSTLLTSNSINVPFKVSVMLYYAATINT